MKDIQMPDIKTLDLNLLKAFDAVMDERNVTRAAARLALTQPAVSGLLTRLRDSFGDPLFLRTQRGVVPTDRAQALAGPIKRVLADIEVLLQPEVFDPATAQMTWTLAATDYALRAIAVPFTQALRLQAPGVRLAVRPVDAALLPAQMESGDVDLALLTPQTAPPGLHVRHLFDESYVCLLRADHPDAQASHLPLERFCSLDHALVSLGGDAFRGVADEALAQLDRTRRVVFSATSFLVLPELLKGSDLVAVVPRRLAAHANGLALLEPPITIPGFSKLAVWHARTHRAPGHRWLRALLLATCGAVATE
jgi:DNA-binding transcriptional LysR family regulator